MIKKKMLCFLYPNCTSYAEDTLPSKSCYYLRKKLESPFFLLLSNFFVPIHSQGSIILNFKEDLKKKSFL